MSSTNRLVLAVTGYVILSISACASIPKETVTLSQAVGRDIKQLQSGYRKTIRFSFNQIRHAGLTTIDNVWRPAYVKTLVIKADLVEAAKRNQIDRIMEWASAAIEDIDKERQKFLKPLQEKEDALLADVDDAFDQLIRANASITANLNSVLKVQRLQNQIVEAAGLSEIRKKINSGIEEVSTWASKATKKNRDVSAHSRGMKS